MAQWTELPIENGDLEPEYTPRPDPNEGGVPVGEVTVAHGWYPYCRPKQPGDLAPINKRPEWVYNEERSAQKVFTTWGKNSSGVFQRIDVPVGMRLKLEVDAMYSDEGCGVALCVGIDPLGSGVPTQAVVWSRWHGNTPRKDDPGYWPDQSASRTITLEGVVSVQQSATIFLKHENINPGKDASAFWQAVRLYAWVDSGPPPAPPGEGLGDVVVELKTMNEHLAAIAVKL